MKDGPNHILTQLRILRCQPEEVRDIVTYYVQTGAWNSCSENVLTALILSPLKEGRIFSIDQIRKMRGDKAFGEMGVRKHLTPKLNLSARDLISLISWENDVHEPVFTCSIPSIELNNLISNSLLLPNLNYLIHTQSTERAIKSVTEAAAAVIGEDARNGFVRARIHHRTMMPVFKTKKDILNTK